MHGDEVATVHLLENFIAETLPQLSSPVAVLPLCNPDGYERRTRYNARGVDLNRNFGCNWRADSVEPSGTAAWTEPESCALRDYIIAQQPAKIVSLHWALAEIDADGAHSAALAHAMWNALDEQERAPYRLRVSELGRGQRLLEQTYNICPGSLGQWCGYELEYDDGSAPAMITLELPYHSSSAARLDPLPEDHLNSLHELWASDSASYMSAIEPAVTKMLIAACAHRANHRS
jgi:hypothetical protein